MLLMEEIVFTDTNPEVLKTVIQSSQKPALRPDKCPGCVA